MQTAIVRPLTRLQTSKFMIRLCAFAVVIALSSVAFAQTDNWIGNNGVWSDPTQWNLGVPMPGDNIVIGSAAANATDDFNLSVGTLTLSNTGDTLVIPDGVSLAVTSSVSNAGSMQMNSAGTNTFLMLNGNVSLTGNGTLALSSVGPNIVEGASGAGTEVLTNASTINGAGNIGNGPSGHCR